MTNIIKEAKKLNLPAGFFSDLSYYARSQMWKTAEERNHAEENDEYDKAKELYDLYIELKMTSKEAEEIFGKLFAQKAEKEE